MSKYSARLLVMAAVFIGLIFLDAPAWACGIFPYMSAYLVFPEKAA